MNELPGKTAVITGGGSGIGEAVVRLFADEGASRIVVADINEQKGEALAEQIGKTGCSCRFVKTDISDPAQITRLFGVAKEHCGKLDILVNCAGVCHVTPLKDAAGEDWDMQIDINLRGTFLCCREALAMMELNRYGKIVNVTSISGRIGGIRTSAGYVASKGGVISLTRSLAKGAAPDNINVNCVAPGVIATEMTKDHEFHPGEIPMGRKGTAKETAEVVAFLASDRASYLVGTTIDVNGGSYMG